MPKSMRTVAELAKAVAVLQTRDRLRARQVKALDRRVDDLEYTRWSEKLGASLKVSPATPPARVPPVAQASGSALERVRLFFKRIVSRSSAS